MKQKYSVGSVLIPVFGPKVKRFDNLVDVICLFALVAGMAASLGTGTMTIAGGLQRVFGLKSAPLLWAIVITVIVTTFIISSVSGIMKGIRVLSDINAKAYMILLVFLIVFGPTAFMLNFSVESYGAYLRDFLPMSLSTGEIFGDSWARSWPVFYWCNWLSWTPITAIFLAKILRGYTFRDAIKCNFVIPALFSTIWMGIFASSSIYYEMNGLGFNEMMQAEGTESVVYAVLSQMPLSIVLIVFYLFIVFISFVTASDSNTNAMAGLCTTGITDGEQEAPSWLKVVWGISIAVVTWIVISFAGIDGIKAASNLGGFPTMFLMIIMIVGLLKICKNPSKYDTFKEDYKEDGTPIESERLPIKSEEG
ncbi:MAG: BCCT family transporter [Blautia sp.]